MLALYGPREAGRSGRRALRELERQVRRRALACAKRLVESGRNLDEAACRLGLKARTLRHWQSQEQPDDSAVPLPGRPPADSGVEQQQAALVRLQDSGPGFSVPGLRREFPTMSRSELDELVKCYRLLWREQHRRPIHVLHWQRPGTVWAMDFAEAPSPIDGVYPHLLAVRDLASGKQLLWRPVTATTSEVVRAELTALFLAYGTPWVLKSDNGPAFRADETKKFLARWDVFTLYSPSRTPSYNGSIEAAIGSLKTRTQRQVEQSDHPEVWTSAAAENARQEANMAQPRRLHGATSNEVWDERPKVRAEEREAFRATFQQFQAEARREKGSLPEDEVSHWVKAAVDRVALRRALVAHDLLLFRRRRIPAEIMRPKVAING